MRYLCLASGSSAAWSRLTQDQQQAYMKQCRVHDIELAGDPRVKLYAGLQDGGKVVRHQGGKRIVTDGPFIESREIGGVFIVEAGSLDEAVELAATHPAGRMGEELGWHVEVRPLFVPEA
jgi:hypothetical protein